MKDININNIADVTQDELLEFMYEKYANVVACKEEGLDYSDLATVQGCMGWIQNVESFLMPLIAKMDIMVRNCKKTSQPQSPYQNAMGKKYILTLYYEHLEHLYRTLSRQCSLFTTQSTYTYDMETRSDNILKKASENYKGVPAYCYDGPPLEE